MPENLMMNLVRVLKSSRHDGEAFTISYCPNMHPFFITGCGHPTEKIICAVDGCGKEIGDTTHSNPNCGMKLLEIPKGYILDGSDDELTIGDLFWRYEGMTQIRKISEVACTLMRLLIHLALLIRNAAVPEGCKQLQKLLQKENATEVTKFLGKQAIGYFRLLGKITRLNDELLSVVLHQILDNLPQTFNQWYPNGLNGIDLTTTYAFETKFDSQYCSFFSQTNKFNDLNNRSKIAVNEDKALKIILSEIEETRVIDECYRKQYIPHLFLTIHNVTFDDLAQRFMIEPSLKRTYPLLYHVMCSKYELWSVKYLPTLAQWIKRVHLHFSQKITKQECQKKTIAQTIEELEKKTVEMKWSHINNYGVASKHVGTHWQIESLEFSIARDNENGLIIVKIIELLQDIHNEFLENVMLMSKKYANNEEKEDAKNDEKNEIDNDDHKQIQQMTVNNKPLFDIHKVDIINLDKDQVTEIISQWSLPLLEYGAIHQIRNNMLDLRAIENEIEDRFVKNRQMLEIGIPLFQFSNQLNIKVNMAIIEENNKEMKKESIDHPLLKLVLSSLKSKSDVQRALEILNEVIIFVSQNIKIIDLDKRFVELLEQMSFDEKDCKLFAMNVEEEQESFILCRHMCNLCRLLHDAVLKIIKTTAARNDKKDTFENSKGNFRSLERGGTISGGEAMRDLKKKEPFCDWLENIIFFENELEFFPRNSLTWEYCAAVKHYLFFVTYYSLFYLSNLLHITLSILCFYVNNTTNFFSQTSNKLAIKRMKKPNTSKFQQKPKKSNI
ncbi:hypothetical protein RFI_35647, partial [Reticulomyxa filosa]